MKGERMARERRMSSKERSSDEARRAQSSDGESRDVEMSRGRVRGIDFM